VSTSLNEKLGETLSESQTEVCTQRNCRSRAERVGFSAIIFSVAVAVSVEAAMRASVRRLERASMTQAWASLSAASPS